ncbi:MAG: autotransporter outer membrane beta-barrel domain-containing protein [Alphaproteobacteria bacterium]|nr:autotransporter outer membrane beta-barrel domain-containing protein [Alphaproteobacteria bacterium]
MQADTRSPAKARALAPVSPGEADALAAPDVASLSMWMQGFGGSGSIEGDRVTRGLRHDVSGLAGGIEARYGAFKAGVAGGYSDGSYDVRSLQASMQGEVVHVGGYLGYEGEAAFAGLFGSYVEGDFDSTRRVSAANVRTLTAQAEVDMKGRTLGGFAGYRAPLGNNIVLAPMVGATNIRIKRDGFDETGADPLNLQVSQETREVTYGTAQLRLSSATPVSGGTFEPYLAGGVERYWGDLRAVSTMRFAGAAGDMGSFRIIGAPLEKTVGAFGAGFDVRPNDRIEIGASAGVRVGDRVTQSTVEMHARIRF